MHLFDVPEGTPDSELPRPVLVVEVSDRTFRRDSGIKLRIYAEAGIPEYWIINLKERRIAVCRDPHNPTGTARGWAYRDIRHVMPGQSITPLSLPGETIAVDEMLP